MGMEGNLERKNGNRETHSTQHLTEGSREKVWPGTLHKIICRRPTRHGKVNFDNLLTSFGDNHLSLPSVINRFGSVSVSVVNFVSGSRLQFSKGLTNMYEPATTSMYAAYDNIQRPPLKTFCTLAWRCLKRKSIHRVGAQKHGIKSFHCCVICLFAQCMKITQKSHYSQISTANVALVEKYVER